MWTQSKETLERLTPQKALDFLREGNHRFVNNLNSNRNLLRQVNQTSEGQFPFATILSCIDSRTSAELIFDQGLGDIFSIRIAGNVLNDDILGSMEFACGIAQSKVIVVLGHTNCGAVTSACNGVELGYLTALLNKIKPVIDSEITVADSRNGSNTDFVTQVAVDNVRQTIRQIRERSLILKNLESEDSILLIGGLYSTETGEVRFFEEKRQ